MKRLVIAMAFASGICLAGATYELSAGPDATAQCVQPANQCWFDFQCTLSGNSNCGCQLNVCWPWESCPNKCVVSNNP